jgi:hypothetical protein
MNANLNNGTFSLDDILDIASRTQPKPVDGPTKIITGSVVIRSIASKPGAFGVDVQCVDGRKVSGFYAGDVGMTRLARLAQLVKHHQQAGDETVTLRIKTKLIDGREYVDIDA